MKTKNLTILFLLGLLVNCGKPVVNSNLNGTNSVFQAVCQLLNAQNAVVVCIDFPANVVPHQTSCSTTERQSYASDGVVGSEYIGMTGAGSSTSCQLTNPTVGFLASCGLNDRFIRYYPNFGSSSKAYDDCKARGGNPYPNN